MSLMANHFAYSRLKSEECDDESISVFSRLRSFLASIFNLRSHRESIRERLKKIKETAEREYEEALDELVTYLNED